MLILNIAENFFHQILQRNDACRTTKFVHHYSNRFFLLHEQFHQFVSRHRFGYNRHFLHVILPVCRIPEHFRRVNISHHIIYISIIYYDFRNTRLHKKTFQFFQCGGQIYSYHLCTRYNTVAYLYIRKIKRILEYLYLCIQFFFTFRILYARLDEVIQIHFAKSLGRRFLVYFHPKYPKEQIRQSRCKF